MFELSVEAVVRLRQALNAADFTVGGVQRCLGASAHGALHRNETTPGRLALSERKDPVATLTRLFLLQDEVSSAEVEAALPSLAEPLSDAGILFAHGGLVNALVDIHPYGSVDADGADRDLWVIADLTPGMDGARPTVTPDHVLGINSAATTLAQLALRRPVSRALDLGTGCGVQALHLASHAQHIIGTDVNPRALEMARLTAALNGVSLELRTGSAFEPVDGEQFDLIVSNPPFVISPRGGLTYRDSGLAGDEFCRRLVQQAPRYLTDGGVCQLLANWLHVSGESWQDRLGHWVAGSGCDAWIIQREVSDPAEYVELWLKDAGLHGAAEYRSRYSEWLQWFSAQGAEGIGFGWIFLRRTSTTPVVRIEDWPHPVQQPIAPEVARWFDVSQLLFSYDEKQLLSSHLLVADDVHVEHIGEVGAPDPSAILLKQRGGLGRTVQMDTALAGFVGACDGDLTVGQISDALAKITLDVPPESVEALELRRRLAGDARSLLQEGFLHLA